MKSDSDFANPYERDLYAQEERIHQLEEKLKVVEEIHNKYVETSCDLYKQLEEKLKGAVELNNEYWTTLGECMDFSRVILDYGNTTYALEDVKNLRFNAQRIANAIANLKLRKIKGTK